MRGNEIAHARENRVRPTSLDDARRLRDLYGRRHEAFSPAGPLKDQDPRAVVDDGGDRFELVRPEGCGAEHLLQQPGGVPRSVELGGDRCTLSSQSAYRRTFQATHGPIPAWFHRRAKKGPLSGPFPLWS
jgi:hypothetical protein